MERQKTILFLPFLQIPSGHYQVAEALKEGIRQKQPEIRCEIIDILSYSFGKMEAVVSKTYLKWIKASPRSYSWIYRTNVYANLFKNKRFRLYEFLFLKYMRKLLAEKQPDLIICTHALPSYIVNYLKGRGEVSTPIINVYTDYFVHRVWGIRHIDYHFIPLHETKDILRQKGVEDHQIFITGIPIHHKIIKAEEIKPFKSASRLSVLITGGSLGVGTIEELVAKIDQQNKFHFYILCGTNKDLYQKITRLQKSNITPLEYIKCRDTMNKLYNQVDAIVTKPGGVTVSESLFKGKPIFIYHALPGQEEINLQVLEKLGLIIHLKQWREENKSLGEQLSAFFQDRLKVKGYQNELKGYREKIIRKSPAEIITELLQ